MTIDLRLKQDIFNTFQNSSLVMEAIGLIEKGKLLEGRAVLSQIMDEYRELNPTERFIITKEDIDRHNLHVETLTNMESCYSAYMAEIEKYELLRQ